MGSTSIRADWEVGCSMKGCNKKSQERRRMRVQDEVTKPRTEISRLKVEISTITKGVPIAKLELRHQRLPVTKTSVQEAKVIVNEALEQLLRQEAAPAQLQAWGQT